MENKNLFKSFDYVVRNLFTYEDKVEVKVFFIYKELNVITKPLFIKKLNDKNNAYYLGEAKKITEKMINDGSLKKECEKKVIRKKLLPILIPIVSAMAIAGITVGCYYGLQTKAQEVNVDVPETNGLIFDNQTAYIGQDYNTNISVNTVLTDCVLPDELTKVISGNRELLKSEYTYTVSEDKLSATLYISGKYIEGDVRIELTLVEPGPVIEYVDFTFTSESCSIKDKEGKDVTQVIKGETFEGKISLNQETTGMHLPSMLDITMGDVPVPLSDYEFNPYTGEFSIVPTGDIKISVEQDNSDAMFIYQYVAGGRNAFAFDIIPSSSECKIYWGDTDTPQIITAAGRYTHTYEVTTDGTRYTIKVSGVDSTSFENVMVVNYTGDQLVSAAYFDNAESDINEDGYGEPSLLEELYIGKKIIYGSITYSNKSTYYHRR